MKHKVILAVLIVLALALILAQSWETIRFAIVRATMSSDIPEWLKSFLWGWR